eukprot:scaffold5307_cov159-Ochromonas_danica.AAC.3
MTQFKYDDTKITTMTGAVTTAEDYIGNVQFSDWSYSHVGYDVLALCLFSWQLPVSELLATREALKVALQRAIAVAQSSSIKVMERRQPSLLQPLPVELNTLLLQQYNTTSFNKVENITDTTDLHH